VIGYDDTGLVMRLSDRVIGDIARRLGTPLPPQALTQMPLQIQDPAKQELPVAALDPAVLGDIDAWNLRQSGEWYVFQANLLGGHGVRQYRKLVDPGNAEDSTHILADAPGALLGLLSIGGARAALALPRSAAFTYHIMAPADDIGAVGMAGVEAAQTVSHLHKLREVTRDALLAEVLLTDRKANNRAIPLCMVRAETDNSASIANLATGAAFANLMTAARSLAASAERLHKPARVLCVRLDYSLEDVFSTDIVYRDGLLVLLDQITTGLAGLGFHKPVFLANFDCGTQDVSDHPALRAHGELAWNHADHDLVFASPGYCFAQDNYGRPTPQGMQHMAELEAQALTAIYDDTPWFCPTFLLAEREPGNVIRLRARAMGDLVLDAADPFGAGADCGFYLLGDTRGARIASVRLDPTDRQDILLGLEGEPGSDLQLCYALTAPARGPGDPAGAYPAARGAVREVWQITAQDGTILHRWALPCVLNVH
jgi:hypothetical protein